MKEEIRDLIEELDLRLCFKFIDFEQKIISQAIKQIENNPFLSFCEKQKLIKEYYG
jgi:hypothetical protein